MELVLVRSLERVLAILIGGVAIYLGYRLFLAIPDERDSEGKVNLPGGISIFLTRVGPGVFFALFGAAVVGASLYFSVKIQVPGGEAGAPLAKEGPVVSYSGMGEMPKPTQPGQAMAGDREEIQRELAVLRRAQQTMEASVDPGGRQEIDGSFRKIKVRLMKDVWGEDWGDWQSFLAWAVYGARPVDDAGFRRAREFYEGESGGGS